MQHRRRDGEAMAENRHQREFFFFFVTHSETVLTETPISLIFLFHRLFFFTTQARVTDVFEEEVQVAFDTE